MASHWSRTDAGLEIQQTGPLLIKLLGLPFLAFGLYLLWHLLTGLAGFFVPSLGQLTVAGALVLPVFVLLVGVPGWLLVVSRKRTLVETATRRVVEVWDHLVYRHRKERPVPPGSRVRIRLEQSQSTGSRSGRTPSLLHVDIVGADMEIPLGVFFEHEAEPARSLALEAAGLLGLPVNEASDEGVFDHGAEMDEETAASS
jgi:hypothetical protein